MNAAVGADARKSVYGGIEVCGVQTGYHGLREGKIEKLALCSVGDISDRGGTILISAGCDAFKTDAGQEEAINQLKNVGIEGLIVIGGDGSFHGAKSLSEKGF